MWTIQRSTRLMSLGGTAGLLLGLLLFFLLDISSTGAQQPPPTVTGIPSVEPTLIITVTAITATPGPTQTPTAPATLEPTAPPPTITATSTAGPSPTPSATLPPEPTGTLTPEPTATITATATLTVTATGTATGTPTDTLTPGPSPTGTATLSPTLTVTPTVTPTVIPTATLTLTPVPTTTVPPTATPIVTPTATPTATITTTPSPSVTPVPTATTGPVTPTTVIEPPMPREPSSAGAVQPRTLTVIGRGAIAVETELVEVEIAVEALRPLLQEAQGAAQGQVAQVLAALRDRGVAEADIETAGVEVRHEPAGDQEGAVSGYRFTHTLRVTLRDLAQVSAILDEATAAGASRIEGLRFRLDNEGAWQTQALIQALDDAEARARQMAAYYGLELGDVVAIRQLAALAGEERPAAARHIPLDESALTPPGQVRLSVQVEVVFSIRNAP